MKIAAVIITRDRLSLLQECLSAVRSQTWPCDIYVINNASSDGTEDWLSQQGGITVITQSNQGGAGGFFTGIKVATEAGYDWVWCMDDDTIPDSDALERMVKSPEFSTPSTGFITSVVRWTDGNLHSMNQPFPVDLTWKYSGRCASSIPITSTSFVSVLISREAVLTCGLPLREFFIWGDDYEYTRRISARFPGFFRLDSEVLHATPKNSTASLIDFTPSQLWKFRYGVRNLTYLAIRSEPSLYRKGRRFLRETRDLFVTLRAIDQLEAFSPLFLSLCKGAFFFHPKIAFCNTAD